MLENRLAPAVTVVVDANGLRINGDDAEDAIALAVDQAGRVTNNGQVLLDQNNDPILRDQLANKRVEINGGGANDVIDLTNFNIPVQRNRTGQNDVTDADIHIIINGGAGNDLIKGSRGNRNEILGGDGEDNIEGGNDSDRIDGGLDADIVNAGEGPVDQVALGEGDRNLGAERERGRLEMELKLDERDGLTGVVEFHQFLFIVFGVGIFQDLIQAGIVDKVEVQNEGPPASVRIDFNDASLPMTTPDVAIQPAVENPGAIVVKLRDASVPNGPEIQLTLENFSSVEVVGLSGVTGSTAVITPGSVPVTLNDMANVVINNQGQSLNQVGNVFSAPGKADIDTGNAQNVVQENLFQSGRTVTKTARQVGDLIEYTVTMVNDAFVEVPIGIVDTLNGAKFQSDGNGDLEAKVFNESGVELISASTVLPGKSSRTIRYFVKPALGTVTNRVQLVGIKDPVDNSLFHVFDEDSVVFQAQVPSAGAVLNDVALNGMASTTNAIPDSIPLKSAGNAPLYTTAYTDIYLNAPTNSTFGHLAYGDPFMVDVAPDGFTPGNGFASDPAGDATGRFIAFRSSATNLVADVTDTNATNDIFLRDMFQGTTILVSRKSSDPSRTANGQSIAPVVSGDGRYVYFLSLATDLVATPVANSQFNLYRFTVATGALELVNINADDTSVANKGVSGVSTTFNGEIVVFVSAASDLTDEAQNNGEFDGDIFVRDMAAGVTELVSRHHTNATTAAGVSQDPVISRDGATIVYASNAADIVTLSDANNGQANKVDIFAYDMATKTNSLVSVNAAGSATGDKFSTLPRIAAHGRFVLFQSEATDLVTGIADLGADISHLYVRDLVNGTTEMVTVDPTGLTAGNNDSAGATISDDGRFVAFHSRATNLTGHADSNNNNDVFVRDRLANLTTLASVNVAGDAAGDRGSLSGGISGDGSTIFFTSFAEDLVLNDGNNNNNVFSSSDHRRFRFRLAGDGSPTHLLLRQNGANYEIVNADTSAVLATRPALATETIVINGPDNENDTLTIDLASGPFLLLDGILFDGGAGGTDQLILLGNKQAISHGPINATDGIGSYDGLVIGYQNLEALEDRAAAATRWFMVPETANPQARLADDGNLNNGLSRIDDNGAGTFLAHVFANPTTSLIIEGTRGDDVLTAVSVDAAFAAAVQFNGLKGNDLLDAAALSVIAALDGGPGDDILRSGSGNDLLIDGAGDDDLTGGGGDDVYRLTPGSADVVTDSAGSDTLDFSLAGAAITINLDQPDVAQVVNAFGDTVKLVGVFENFVGSALNDAVFARALNVPRQLIGGPQVFGLPPGDSLTVDSPAFGVTDVGGVIAVPGFAPIQHADLEVRAINAPNVVFGPNKVTGADSDGDKYIVTLTGPGRMAVIVNDPGNTGSGPIDRIVFEGTDPAKSKITVAVTKNKTGDGIVNVGAVAGTGLKELGIAASNLVGAGIELTGPLGALRVRDILTGTKVQATGTPAQTTTIAAHVVQAGTTINVGSALTTFSAAAVQGGAITAARIGTLTVSGDTKNKVGGIAAPIAGDFHANVNLTGSGDPKKPAVLTTATIAGAINGGAWQLNGDAGSVTVKGALTAWNAAIQGKLTTLNLGVVANAVVNVNRALTSVTAKGWAAGALTAASVGTIKIAGDFGAVVTITGVGLTGKTPGLNSATVSGTINNAVFRVAGNVNTFTAARFIDSQFLVGFVPTDPADPIAGGAFTAGLKINTFNVNGLPKSAEPAFVGSTVAADVMGTVKLKSVQSANAGKKFGVVAGTAITNVTIAVPPPGFKFNKLQPTPQGFDDFVVTID